MNMLKRSLAMFLVVCLMFSAIPLTIFATENDGTALPATESTDETFTETTGETDEESAPLRNQLRKVYTPLQGFCIMLFCLLSIPCLATLAITKREMNSWKMACAEAAGLFVLAYVVTFIVYNIGLILNIGTKLLG